MDITTPAIIFPAISMLMLAYTNRFMVISQRIRMLRGEYQKSSNPAPIVAQISNLRLRFILIRWMQATGVLAFLLCSVSILMILFSHDDVQYVFGAGIVFLIISLLIALWEILISTKAIDIDLKDLEHELQK